MKEFIKFTLATVTGLILTGIVLSIFSTITLVGLIAASETETVVKKNSVLAIDLSGSITEQEQDNPLNFLLGDEYSTSGLKEICAALEKAKQHKDIQGVYLKAGVLVSAAPATLQELRNALLDFKQSGKFIVAYADSYTQGNYYVCSVADRIMLNPQGQINWVGMASQPMFYKDLLDKVGVEMQVFKVGTYKSAVEPYLLNSMSDANREQMTAYLHSIWGQLKEGVAQSRSIPADSLDAYADRYAALEATADYLSMKLVDTLVYQSEVKGCIKELMQLDKKKSFHTLSLKEMANVEVPKQGGKKDNVIAVYYAEGGIDMELSEEGINSKKMCKALRKLAEDDAVKAVVLRVNSPGGSAFGSEQIWHEVVALKEKKPVIVSMGGYAASGGYYISCAADRIVAEPTTLTGSIGIFGMFPNMKGLLTDKLGIHTDVVKTNRFSDMGTTFRALDPGEREHLQAYINRGYDLFVTRCADGRGLSKDSICKVAEGRVWTGEMALQIGLVDELGGLDRAIAAAAEKADLTEYAVEGYPEPENFLMSLLNKQKEDFISARMDESLGEYKGIFRFLKSLRKQDRIQALLPFDPNFNL